MKFPGVVAVLCVVPSGLVFHIGITSCTFPPWTDMSKKNRYDMIYADDTRLHLSFKPGAPPNKSPGNEVDSLPPDDSWDSLPVFTTTREISAVLLAESRGISASFEILDV